MTHQDPIAAIELAHRRGEGKAGPLLANELRPQTFEQAFSLQQAVGQIFAGVPASEVASMEVWIAQRRKNRNRGALCFNGAVSINRGNF